MRNQTADRHLEVSVVLVRETDRAYLVRRPNSCEEVWVPKSQVEIHDDGGPFDVLVIPVWLAREKDLL